MKVLGLVTEYNPFHNGHKYHLLESIKKTDATHTIAVMSGNFLQRGEPALTNKWYRAEMAVREGVDLILELPVLYACSSAEFFSFGAISLLNNLNIVNEVCFGSECGDIEVLTSIAKVLLLEPPVYKESLRNFLSEGLSFPVARAKSLAIYFNNTDISKIVNSPNNILGIEYIKSIFRINSQIIPATIERVVADYHSSDIKANICSATAIRSFLKNTNYSLEDLKKVMPTESFNILTQSFSKGYGPVFLSDLEQSIFMTLRRISKSSLQNIMDVEEGLENRIIQASLKSYDLDQFFACVKTKRYTMTRLQRIIIHTLLNIKTDDYKHYNSLGGPQYVRVLAMNSRGRTLLKKIREVSSLPILTNLSKQFLADEAAKDMLAFDILASNVYSLGYPCKNNRGASSDYFHHPTLLK